VDAVQGLRLYGIMGGEVDEAGEVVDGVSADKRRGEILGGLDGLEELGGDALVEVGDGLVDKVVVPRSLDSGGNKVGGQL